MGFQDSRPDESVPLSRPSLAALLRGGMAVCLLATPIARPAEDCPPAVSLPSRPPGKIKAISAGGDDCPPSDTTAEISPDRVTATLSTPNLAVSDAKRTAACTMTVDFEIPKGYRLARMIPTWRGKFNLPDDTKGVSGDLTISSQILGARRVEECRNWTQAGEEAFSISSVVPSKTACGAPVRLEARVSLRLKGQTLPASASVAVGSLEIDASPSSLFQLEPCDSLALPTMLQVREHL